MWNLAQTTNYYTTTNTSSGIGVGLIIFYLLLLIVFIAAIWKVFEKAGQAGWKAIIPIYSTVIMCRIVGISGWYTLLVLVPFVNIIFSIYLAYKMALSFGYGIGMTILEVLAIGYLILGFGSAKYIGPSGAPASAKPAK
jgi:hypothetical protein